MENLINLAFDPRSLKHLLEDEGISEEDEEFMEEFKELLRIDLSLYSAISRRLKVLIQIAKEHSQSLD